MIIDTNGFEIGDEVWVVFRGLGRKYGATPSIFRVAGVQYCNGKTKLMSEYETCITIDNVYHTQQDCQLECDRLNGVNHD